MSAKNLGFIMSPSYSGSTLLSALLVSHPKIASVGELKATSMGNISSYRCSCGDLIAECDFWREVIARTHRNGMKFSLNDFGTHFSVRSNLAQKVVGADVKSPIGELARKMGINLIPGAADFLNNTLEQNMKLMQLIMEIQEGSVFLDGSKDPLRARYFAERTPLNVKVIRIDRDGRGVARSIAKHYRVSFGVAVKVWRRAMTEVIRQWEQIEPQNKLRVSYEGLCLETEEVLMNIWCFLGLDPRIRSKSRELHILGNNVRVGQFDGIRLDEKWRKELSEAELRLFESEGGDLNRSLGYAAI